MGQRRRSAVLSYMEWKEPLRFRIRLLAPRVPLFFVALPDPSLPHASLVMEFWSAAQLCVNNITAGRSPGPIRLVPVRRRQMAEAWLLGCSQLLRLSKQAQLINEEQKRPTSKSLLLGRAK